MVKKSNEIDIDLKELMIALVSLVIIYIIYTNFVAILVGGIIGILLFLIITVVAAYYILPAIGITALAGLITAIATLIGSVKAK